MRRRRNENITVDHFDYIFDRAVGGDRRVQDDFLIYLPGSAPGSVPYQDFSDAPFVAITSLYQWKLFLRLRASVPFPLSSRST